MKIYGVALLAFCYLTGKLIGNLLGQLMGLQSDVGGVGFAMVLLVLLSAFFYRKGWMPAETESGIKFWSGMYLPIIVAMAATQNVNGALSGGLLPILIGLVVTGVAFVLIPIIARIGKP